MFCQATQRDGTSFRNYSQARLKNRAITKGDYMKRKYLEPFILMVLYMSIVAGSTSYAETTIPDYAENSEEEVYDPEDDKYLPSDKDMQQYKVSQEDHEEIMRLIDKYETKAPAEKGTLHYTVDPSDVKSNPGNILLYIYREGNQESVLIKDGEFDGTIDLPVGTYTFGYCVNQSKKYSFYPLENTFTIKEGGSTDMFLSTTKGKGPISVEEAAPDPEFIEEAERIDFMRTLKKDGIICLVSVICFIGFGTAVRKLYKIFRKHEESHDNAW